MPSSPNAHGERGVGEGGGLTNDDFRRLFLKPKEEDPPAVQKGGSKAAADDPAFQQLLAQRLCNQPDRPALVQNSQAGPTDQKRLIKNDMSQAARTDLALRLNKWLRHHAPKGLLCTGLGEAFEAFSDDE